jgi:hypothetical protein
MAPFFQLSLAMTADENTPAARKTGLKKSGLTKPA